MLIDLRFYDETAELDEDLFLEEIEAKHAFLKDFVIREIARLRNAHANRAKEYEQ